MIVGYARVSTDDQTTAGQLPDLKKAGCTRIYQEVMSGRIRERPELEKCLDHLEAGDTLMVWRLDRLGRSTRNLIELIEQLKERNINFVSLREGFDTRTASGMFMFTISAAFAQMERELIRERTIAGLSAARARGRFGGRKPKLSPQQARAVRTLWESREHTRKAIAEQFGVSVQTVDRIVHGKSADRE
jgi:DNA invertase Pin-like site-specific DNA recombinase